MNAETIAESLQKENEQLRAKVSEQEQANNRVILDSSDHVRDATKMVPVSREALEGLRVAVADSEHAASPMIVGAARRLLAGGE